MKKSILIITELFSPINGVGAFRASYFAYYLNKEGWKVHVVTIKNHKKYKNDNPIINTSGIETTHVGVKIPENTLPNRIIFQFEKIIAPEKVGAHNVFNKFFAAAGKILKREKIDIIWGTCGPEWVHLLCSRLSAKFKIPWVADFRDLPDPFLNQNILNQIWINRINRRREEYIKTCSSVVSVSDGLLKGVNLFVSRKCVIFNGYDERLHNTAKHNSKGKYFEIFYCGSIYKGRRDPSSLFTAISVLLREKKHLRPFLKIKFVGIGNVDFPEIKSLEISDTLEIIKDRVSYADSIRMMHQASLLIHLSHRNESGIMTTKIFDYLAAQKPILSIPGDNDCVDELLRKTKAGVSLDDPNEIAKQIHHWFCLWMDGKKMIDPNQLEISKYSRSHQSRQLSRVLDGIII